VNPLIGKLLNVMSGLINSIQQGKSRSAFVKTLAVGDPAPEFSLTDQHNSVHKLKAYRGKWVVVYFYPRDETPTCTKEACQFRDNSNAITSKQAVILGVSTDNMAKHQKFATRYNLPFSLLADTDGLVAQRYGALLDLKILRFVKRHSFIIDPEGVVAKIYRNVNADVHVDQVINDLNQLQTQ